MPSIGVSVVVFHEGKVLLTKREDLPVWCLPSGGVHDGETLAQAALRETLEETGINVQLTTLVGVYSRPNWWNGGAHGIVFTARPIGGTLVKQTNETVDAGYFPVDRLPNEILWWHAQRRMDAEAGLKGVVRTQDTRPLITEGRNPFVEAVNRGDISYEEFLQSVAGLPREDLSSFDVEDV